MKLIDFDYALPQELIAVYPEKKRSDAKLLTLNRKTGGWEHRIFCDLIDYLQPGDLLVLNDTQVIPARLYGRRPTGGQTEVLLLKSLGETDWEILLKPSGRVKKGAQILFGENGTRLEGEMLDGPDGRTRIRRIRFIKVGAIHESPLQDILEKIGEVPLPPYINRLAEPADREFYQTVFAKVPGAVASPTAGLHFDEELLKALEAKGVEICFVTLHVGYGTFQSVQEEDIARHEMHEEEFEISETAACRINRARQEKRRIVACGTTVVRVLETVGRETAPLQPIRSKTKIFIYPPYEFKVIDALITNFHLPKTTLLMLVAAFAGRDFVYKAYDEAIRNAYRFFSYGDAMWIA